jgi:hypothetical protein
MPKSQTPQPQPKPPCPHDEVTWQVVEISYNSDGTADVGQAGACVLCSTSLQLDYEPKEPRVLTGNASSKSACKRCGTPLNRKGFCRDVTCPHSDYLQHETWTEE